MHNKIAISLLSYEDVNFFHVRRKRKYRNIISRITTLQLAQPDEINDFTDVDIFTDLTQGRGTSLFLGQYSKRGILFILGKLGILYLLKKKGLTNISVEIDTSRPFQHLLRLIHTIRNQKYLISEIVMRRATFSLPEEIKGLMEKKLYDILIIEWILLQNPIDLFSRQRPQLPGQQYPGLNMTSEAFEILYWIGRRTRGDGVLVVPNYLHSAHIYTRDFFFVNPRYQALITAIQQNLLKQKRLDQVAWAGDEEKIFNRKNNSYLKWKPSEMILPVSRSMNDYFYSTYYRSQVSKFQNDFDFVLDKDYKKHFTKDWRAGDKT